MRTPAFPAMHYDLADNEHGLTMRDYFAAKAMQPFLDQLVKQGWVSDDLETVAETSYRVADEMLKARQA
jgi:hypothetical protein